MATTSYEGFSLSPTSDYRRLPERRASHEVSPGHPRRRSPSPIPARRYNNYIPTHADRTDYPNVYRPSVFHPTRSYYSRSPSPDRHNHPRVSDSDARDLSPLSPSHASSSRLRLPPSSPSLSRERSRRDMLVTPMFEPSDAWKQAHPDRPAHLEVSRSSPLDQYSDQRRRDSGDRSLEVLPQRSPQYYPGGDRHRPPAASNNNRDPYPFARADCYRPQYEDDEWASTRSRERSRSVERRVRGSNPPTQSRLDRTRCSNIWNSSCSSCYTESRETSRGRHSVSPNARKALHVPSRTPGGISSRESSRGRRRSVSPYEHRSRDSSNRPDERPLKRAKLRSLSRSSIASSRASENQQSIESSLPPPRANLVISSVDPAECSVIPGSDDRPTTNGIDLKPQPTPHTPLDVVENKHLTTKPTKPGAQHDDPSPTPRENQHKADLSIMPTQRLDASKGLSDAAVDGRILKLQDDPKEYSPPDLPENDTLPKLTVQPGLPSLPLEKTPPGHAHSPSYQDDAGTTSNDRFNPIPKRYTPIVSPWSPPASPIQVDRSSVVTAQPASTSAQRNHSLSRQDGAPFTSDDSVNMTEEFDYDLGSPLPYIPRMEDAKSLSEALQVVVATRLRCDSQTREERVDPVLMANLSLARSSSPKPPAAKELVCEITEGSRLDARMKSFVALKPTLVTRFAERHVSLAAKSRRIRQEYLARNERWLAHCARLDGASKPGVLEDPAPNPGRTTRRSAATLGDAVRSDLEMEQIIASLGNDDLTDPNHLAVRNVAVVPDLISVVAGRVDYLYDDTNNLVEDPSQFYAQHTGIHDWTDEEKEIFLDKFAAYPKQFGIIAEHLPNKSAAQCVDFYYLHKKTLIDFRKVVSQLAPNKRRRGTRRDRQKGNGLLADIRRHDDEVHRDSVSTLQNGPTTRRRWIMPISTSEAKKPGPSRRSTHHLEATPVSTPTPEPETRQAKRRSNASSRVNVAVDQCDGDEERKESESKSTKKGRSRRRPKASAPSEDPNGEIKSVDQNAVVAARRKAAAVNVQWSEKDKNIFLSLLAQYGDDFKRIAASMPNKTTIQVSNYYKSNLVELNLAEVAAGAPKRSPTPELAREVWNGSGNISRTTSVDGITNTSRRLHLHDLLSASGDPPPVTSVSWLPSLAVEDTSSTRSESTRHGRISDASTRLYSPTQAGLHSEPLVTDDAPVAYTSTSAHRLPDKSIRLDPYQFVPLAYPAAIKPHRLASIPTSSSTKLDS